jgi:hypothetical protein
MADRPVVFDGASQNNALLPNKVGELFLTDNEAKAASIVRLLSCGNGKGYELINDELQDTVKSVDLLDKIILMNPNNARLTLKEAGVKNIDEILSTTHCIPPQETIIIVSGDMVGKAPVWGFFGSWNFTRAEIYNSVKSLDYDLGTEKLIEKYGMNQQDASNTYFEIQKFAPEQWVAPWPSFENNYGYMSKSMFSKLYFDEGKNLSYYKLIHKATDFTGSKILVYKIEWAK